MNRKCQYFPFFFEKIAYQQVDHGAFEKETEARQIKFFHDKGKSKFTYFL